ncbi:hypothetical protein AAG570_006648 [Ranatra chinensis]|uniref:Uncharacterized protein n=1 Tax=Ranatra chinensis TaxID=642074 RepID=A0ABD0YUL5_9HEMI
MSMVAGRMVQLRHAGTELVATALPPPLDSDIDRTRLTSDSGCHPCGGFMGFVYTVREERQLRGEHYSKNTIQPVKKRANNSVPQPLITWDNVALCKRCCSAVFAAMEQDAAGGDSVESAVGVPSIKEVLESVGERRISLLSAIVRIKSPTENISGNPQELAQFYHRFGFVTRKEADSFITGTEITEEEHAGIWLRIFKCIERKLEAEDDIENEVDALRSIVERHSEEYHEPDIQCSADSDFSIEDLKLHAESTQDVDQKIEVPDSDISVRLRLLVNEVKEMLSKCPSVLMTPPEHNTSTQHSERLTALIHEGYELLSTHKTSLKNREELIKEFQKFAELIKILSGGSDSLLPTND